MNRLPAIPVIDLRDGGPPRHAELNTDRARSLRDACLAFFPRAAMPLMPALDWASQRWLTRSRSPYLPEIAQIASTLIELGRMRRGTTRLPRGLVITAVAPAPSRRPPLADRC